jgi:hypothetical protein
MNYEAMQRLGFEAWADNLIVNAIENLDGKQKDYAEEHAQFFLSLKFNGNTAVCAVRVYEPAYGWQFHEREIKV